MNEHIKLALAFGAGVVLTLVFLSLTKSAEAPSEVDIIEVTQTEEADSATTSNEDAAETTQQSPTALSPTPAPVAAPPVVQETYPTSALVRFTGRQFEPETVLIVEGGRVTFQNTSDDDLMHIISGPIPRYDAYPGNGRPGCAPTLFDQCNSVAPGGTWSFTFDELGGWTYYNKEDQVFSGRVRVLTREQFDNEF
ncbi:MAG: hypothetical protein AAGA35_00880 [Patescibacteria group bacterium]